MNKEPDDTTRLDALLARAFAPLNEGELFADDPEEYDIEDGLQTFQTWLESGTDDPSRPIENPPPPAAFTAEEPPTPRVPQAGTPQSQRPDAENPNRTVSAADSRTALTGTLAPTLTPLPAPLTSDVRGLLTAREQEIAALVATGHPNRAIAEELFLSHRAVETHLARIYMKLNVSSRTALAHLLQDADSARPN